jgi:hypothetical protein
MASLSGPVRVAFDSLHGLRSCDDPLRAQSHTPRNRCVRFVAGVAVGSRNTRFLAACWALPGSDLHRLIAPASLGAFRKMGQPASGALMHVNSNLNTFCCSLRALAVLVPLFNRKNAKALGLEIPHTGRTQNGATAFILQPRSSLT